MLLPDLPPDLGFRPMHCEDEADRELAYVAKRAALGPHIEARWGWDEEQQRAFHGQRFAEKPLLEIRRAHESLGTLSLEKRGDHIRFGEFYLYPRFQGGGLGTRILQHCLMQADALGLPVRLEVLQWNPAQSLYRRAGFHETHRTDIHLQMERPVLSG